MDSEKLHIFEILAKQHEPMLLAYVLSLVSDPQLDRAPQWVKIPHELRDCRSDN